MNAAVTTHAANLVRPPQRPARDGQQSETAAVQVLLVGPLGSPPLLGGIENGVQILLNSSLARVFSMRLFNTARLQDPSRPLHKKLLYQVGSCARFVATLIVTRPGVVHVKTSSGINFYQNALYVLIARLLGQRVVLQLHSGGFPAFFDTAGWCGRAVIRTALRLPHELLALSARWERYFRDLAVGRRVSVVGNALRVDDYANAKPDPARLGVPPDRVTLLFVSTRSRGLDREKGLPELIQAVALVRRRRPELLLAIAGPVSHEAELREALGPMGDGWLALGVCPPEHKPMVYRSVDIFALPSHCENMPNTLLESMAAGLPAIATPVGAVPEMIVDRESGFLTPIGDVAGLAERIGRLVDSRTVRLRMGERAAQLARARHDVAVLEQQLLSTYRRIGGRNFMVPV